MHTRRLQTLALTLAAFAGTGLTPHAFADDHADHTNATDTTHATATTRADELNRLAQNLGVAFRALPDTLEEDERDTVRDAMATLIIAGIDLSTITLEEAEALAAAYAPALSGNTDAFLDRLATLAEQNPEQGLDAAVLALGAIAAHNFFKDDEPVDEATTERFITLALDHPNTEALWQGAENAETLNGLLNGLRSFRDIAANHADKLYALAEAAPEEDLPRSHIRSAFSLFNILASTYSKQYADRHEAVRTKFAAYEQDDRFRAVYTSAYGKGQFFNEPAPEMDIIWSSDGDIASLEDLTGSIVVIDFWATWCGPCIASFPKVRELQKHFEGHPVVILGITSPQGAHFGQEGRQQVESNDEEFALMPGFMEWKEMTWPVVFTEENVFNPDYGVQGIPHVTILDTEGRVRHNALHPGNDLPGKVDKINELLEEAGLPTPGPYDDSAA